MSERADDDVRGEQRRAARQPKQQQQQGEASTAMATVGERRSLPSPENMLGQPWSNWVDAAKLHGKDGADSEESLKECAKNREAMRLSRDDMPIFGQCPAQDDFYLVICSHCSQVVKPQAFQAHYDRRHGSASKPHFSTVGAPAAYPSPASARTGGGGAPGGIKILKSAKDKPPVHRRPLFPFKVLPDKIPTSAPKLAHNPASSTTVSTPLKPGLNCPSIPKAPLMSPGQIPNGKGLSLDKKQDNNASNKRQLHKRLPEREFNPDIHCGVLDLVTRKPCTRSLTCKTHSLSQRRAVLGRRKRLDVLLAEHKSRARERERERDHPPPAPSLRDPHSAPEHQQVSHSNGTAHTKAATPSKPKPHNPGLPRLNSSNAHPSAGSQGDPSLTHGSPHHSGPAVPTDKTPRLSSDEGENEEREEGLDKLDYLYSGYHPRPASLCTFGSRQLGRSCYTFSRRWDRVRCALLAMVDKHVNSQMWKRIPPAPENASSAVPNRISGSALPASSHPGFLCPAPAASSAPYPPSFDGRPVLSYGTTLNARASPLSSGDRPACGAQSRQVSSSSSPSPQMPSGLSALPSPFPSRSPKSRPSSKAFRSKEPPASGGHFNSGVVGGEVGSGKKRKNSSPLRGHPPFSVESSPSFSLKKNCAANSGGSGSAYHPSLTFSTTTSSSSSSSSSSHGAGLNCAPSRTGSLGLKHEQSGRGPPSGSPAESIKRMSVVMNSSDSTLSLGPFVHQPVTVEPGGPTQDGRLEGRKRKGSPATGGLHAGPGSGRPKVVRPPGINNVHGKHGRPVPGTQGLPNNSLLQQPKARP